MKLSLNLKVLTLHNGLSIEEIAELVSNAGFNASDYSLGCMTKRENIFDAADYLTVAENIGIALKRKNVPVTQTHTPYDFRFKVPGEFESFIYPQIVRAIEISAAMGAPITVIHPLHHYVYKGHQEEIFQKNMEFYRSLIPIAKANGIKIAIENMWQRDRRRGHISHDTCSTIPEFIRYVDELDSEQIVACLDVGHVGLPPTDDEAWDFIYALGHDRLQSLHIHDNDYKDDLHALPYTGMMDWAKITEALGKIDYSGDFTYELNMDLLERVDAAFLPTVLRYFADVGKHLVHQVNQNRPMNA